MKVQDVMTESVKYCTPDTDLAAAAAIMWDSDIGALPVVSGGGRVMGMLTDRDIAMAVGTRRQLASDVPAGDVISRNLFACGPTEDIHAALKIMRKERVRRLPVINPEGVLLGIVSLNDVVLHAEQGNKKTPGLTYDDVVRSFKAICEHRHPKETAKQAHAATAR